MIIQRFLQGIKGSVRLSYDSLRNFSEALYIC